MDYQVTLSRSARRDLEEIVRYISLDSPDRALEFGLFLVSKAKALGEHPEIGRIVPEFEDPVIREVVIRNYRVIYRVNHARRKVEIIRFWHGRRGTPEFLS
jgi:toxin ParE1/3/4